MLGFSCLIKDDEMKEVTLLLLSNVAVVNLELDVSRPRPLLRGLSLVLVSTDFGLCSCFLRST